MNAGRFDHLVELWSYTTETNSYGEAVKTWAKVSDLWAQIDYKLGAEVTNAEQIQHQQRIGITIRYNSGITVFDQIREGDTIYKIVSISDMGRKMYQLLNCEQSN